MAPVIVRAVRLGFSYEAGYEAGFQSGGIDLDERYVEGWNDGYLDGWAHVTGVALPEESIPQPLLRYEERPRSNDDGGDP